VAACLLPTAAQTSGRHRSSALSAAPSTRSAPTTAAKAAAPNTAQQSSTQEDESVTTIRATVNEVNVVFTVTDKHGRYIKDLKKQDFNFVDDSKPAAEIRDFKSQTDLPLQVGLLVDASNSVRDRFKVRAGIGHRVF